MAVIEEKKKGKKTGKWLCKFYFKDWTGERKQVKRVFKNKIEAMKFEVENKGNYEADAEIKFSGLVKDYLEYCEARLKPSTFQNKSWMFEKHILPKLKNLKVKDITTKTITEWQTSMMKKNNPCKEGEKYTATYLKTLNNQLSACLNYAVKIYGLKKNPCSVVGSMGKSHADVMQFWTIEEFSLFIKVFENELLYKTLFTLMFFSGIRFGEALALTMNDFDVANKTIAISKNLVVIDGKEVIQTPKTEKSNRVVPIPDFVLKMVVQLFNSTVENDLSALLFPVGRTTVRRYFDNGCVKAGVKRIRIHDLRHSHASMLMNIGTPIKQISERLGHEDITITLKTYAHLYKEKESQLINNLNKIGQEMML